MSSFHILGFPLVQNARAFSGDLHQLLAVEPVVHLCLQLVGELDLLAFRQSCDSLFDFFRKTFYVQQLSTGQAFPAL